MIEYQPADEVSEPLSGPTPTRRNLLRGLGIGGGTAAAASLLAACTSSHNGTSSSATAGAGSFPTTPKRKFVFVNHVTTNSFFVPTRHGMQDAAALLGLPTPQWTGSEGGVVSEMVNAMQ